MMRILKWIGIVLGSLFGLLLIAILGLTIYAQVSFKRTYTNRPLYPIEAHTSPEGIARGEYLMEGIMNCTEACHSEGSAILTGYSESIHEGSISFVFAPPNLTPDAETGLGNWSDAEIARAIREAIDKDGVGLVITPAHNYHALSDEDVAAFVGYLRGLEPARNEVPPVVDGNIFAKVMLALGLFGPSPVGKLANWAAGEFIAAVFGGFGEGGRQLGEDMPRYRMDEADLRAVFAYLQTVPAVPSK